MKNGPRALHRLAVIVAVVAVILGMDFLVKQVANARKSAVKTASTSKTGEQSRTGHRFFSPEFHHGFVPLARGGETYGTFRAEYCINSLGMRDESPRKVVGPVTTPRILLMGDSYIDGVGLAYRDTLSGQLAARLPKVEVLNGGVASYCPSLMRDRLRSWIRKDQLRFSLLVVFVDISDTDNEISYAKDPEGQYIKEWSSEFSDFRKSNLARDQQFRLWLQGSVEKNFVLLGAVVRNLRNLYEGAGCPGGTMEWDYADWPSYRGPLEPWIRKSLEKQSQAMDEVHELCRSQGASLVLVVYPWWQQVRKGRVDDRYTLFWREWSISKKVYFLNLYPDFLSVRSSFRDYVLADEDSHWNIRGNLLATQAVLRFLNQHSLLHFLPDG